MKKNLLAMAIAGVCGIAIVPAASAVSLYENANGDYVSLNGRIEVGGYFGKSHTDRGDEYTHYQGFADDSFGDLAFNARSGDVYGLLDIDFERQSWTADNQFQIVLDKFYVGWEFLDGHFVELGRNDTAYDDVSDLGDFSIDGAVSISDAGDQDNTIKYFGSFGQWIAGISYSLDGWDNYKTDSREEWVLNGYVGYAADNWTVLAGAETSKEYGDHLSLHGEYRLNELSLGGLVALFDSEDENAHISSDHVLAVLSAGYQITDAIELVATYSHINFDEEYTYVENGKLKKQVSDNWVTAGVRYAHTDNVTLAAEILTGSKEESYGYGKVYFRF
ncbi:hypothetical protein [Thaumasiovibrio sp. DFM-14]|uniref:hypothetical protein n=1 Tax=Thaumasiovibrio sp. DFM-14 TaxID=3384792 RepID=UPI0039A26CD4